MTQRVTLPNGQTGIIGSPAHKLLQRMAATVTGYAVRGKGASDTQLLALAKRGHVTLHTSLEGRRVIIEGAYLTPHGERYVEMLDAAERHAELMGV
jgi:hypothetical protein